MTLSNNFHREHLAILQHKNTCKKFGRNVKTVGSADVIRRQFSAESQQEAFLSLVMLLYVLHLQTKKWPFFSFNVILVRHAAIQLSPARRKIPSSKS